MAKKISKRMAKVRDGIDASRFYTIEEAIKILKEKSAVKFDETVEVAMNLNVDPRHADQMVRGVVNLPHGTGREVRVAVFAKGDKAEEAKAAGADIVGAEDLVETIQKGEINFCDDRHRRCGKGLQGRRRRVPRREGRYRARWRRQALLQRGGHCREHPRVRGRRDQGQAVGRQG